MRPIAADIAVPPFRPGTRWIGADPGAVERLCHSGLVVVDFICAGDLHSVRALPYLREWRARYGARGLTVLGVNSPRFPFTADPAKLAAALDRLGVSFPVALDSAYAAWRDYGCRVWPSLFLWGPGGALRWYHFGEGDYRATEEEIQAILRERDRLAELPEPLAPLRASDAPGARVVPPSEEIFPGGSIAQPWGVAPGDEGRDSLELEYAAGGAAATVGGEGELRVSLDGEPEHAVAVPGPGLYELAAHDRHGPHRLTLRPSEGLRVYSVSFAAGVP